MNVEEITAFKSEDGSIWENEADAIHSNIVDSINDRLNHNCEGSSNPISEDILKWFRDHPKDIKYIQTNIKKLAPEHFGEEAEE
jgi:hypothetical protein